MGNNSGIQCNNSTERLSTTDEFRRFELNAIARLGVLSKTYSRLFHHPALFKKLADLAEEQKNYKNYNSYIWIIIVIGSKRLFLPLVYRIYL